MKKYSTEARELLSSIELYNIKAGGGNEPETGDESTDCTFCSTCIGCTSCTICTHSYYDIL